MAGSPQPSTTPGLGGLMPLLTTYMASYAYEIHIHIRKIAFKIVISEKMFLFHELFPFPFLEARSCYYPGCPQTPGLSSPPGLDLPSIFRHGLLHLAFLNIVFMNEVIHLISKNYILVELY